MGFEGTWIDRRLAPDGLVHWWIIDASTTGETLCEYHDDEDFWDDRTLITMTARAVTCFACIHVMETDDLWAR